MMASSCLNSLMKWVISLLAAPASDIPGPWFFKKKLVPSRIEFNHYGTVPGISQSTRELIIEPTLRPISPVPLAGITGISARACIGLLEVLHTSVSTGTCSQ